MALQYREDTDRLLYITDTGASDGALMNECCCDTCSDSVACHRYDACCDAATFEERTTYPHYVVISDTKYTALGDPACVIYNGCCYCDHDSTTNKALNVVDTGITTDTSFTSCDSCNNIHEDSCDVCNTCNDCDPRMRRSYVITVDADVKAASYPDTNDQLTLEAELAEASETLTAKGCQYNLRFSDTGVNWTLLRLKQLKYIVSVWDVATTTISGGFQSSFLQDTSDTAANDTCDPTTLPYDLIAGGVSYLNSGTAVVS